MQLSINIIHDDRNSHLRDAHNNATINRNIMAVLCEKSIAFLKSKSIEIIKWNRTDD